MEAFISGLGLISPQETYLENKFPEHVRISENNLLRCVEPAYAEMLNPVMARRMGRLIRMGIAASVLCLRDSGIEKPDAIITGTGLGCLGETEKFLLSVIRDDEQFLTPTSFIQSLPNSVAGQIALHLGCNEHNFTFVHKGFSFESALLDSMMLLHEGDAGRVLAGGLDEMTQYNFHIYKKLGHWKTRETPSDLLYADKTPGTIGGEGSAFFMLTRERSAQSYARLLGIQMMYDPRGDEEIQAVLEQFLASKNLSCGDIDLVLYGYNGDARSDARYDALRYSRFQKTAAAAFKHLCGEYQTSAGFALWLASLILKNQTVPEKTLLDATKTDAVKHLLLYNCYDKNHSFFLLSSL